jgi:hypothetical protein
MIKEVLRRRAFAVLSAIAAMALLGFATSPTASASTAPYWGWQTAYDSSTSALWTAGNQGVADLGLGMAAGTNPAITALSSGAIPQTQIAFQANTSALWTVGSPFRERRVRRTSASA